MVQYELLYWTIKGRGEIVRVTLAAAGLDFKDTRYTLEEWPSYKNSFYGKTVYEEYVIDEVVECVMHILNALIQLETCTESLKKKVTERYNEVCERVLEYVESKLEPGQLYIVGNSVSCRFIRLEESNHMPIVLEL
uniref:GST N-terminal domain-containing protein n=1 Tax=Octopus bimaculoides TaxID=37653 RepID=A0A0L8HFV1_OCTBM